MLLQDEKDVKKRVKEILITLGIYWFMPPASIYGRKGIADFVCCVKGLFIAIETKKPEVGERGLTSHQKRERNNIRAARGMYFCVWNEQTLAEMGLYLSQLMDSNEKTV
jgi:hypothetical protein